MSWNGTVRCGHCYQPGHNRLGCPDRRKIALENPDGYIGRAWHREQEERKRQIESRVCSYCKEPKHNRRGCALLKEDRKLITKRQEEYRHEFHQVTSSAGFGPGALVKVPTGSRSDQGGPWSKGWVAMVTKIDWPNVDFLLKDTNIAKDWRNRERALATARVVSSFGYDDEPGRYYGPPSFNEVKSLTAIGLHQILQPVFNEDLDLSSDQVTAYELVGPVGSVEGPPSLLETISNHLKDRFNLNPGPRASDFEKERRSLSHEEWSVIRKEEYNDFHSSWQQNEN